MASPAGDAQDGPQRGLDRADVHGVAWVAGPAVGEDREAWPAEGQWLVVVRRYHLEDVRGAVVVPHAHVLVEPDVSGPAGRQRYQSRPCRGEHLVAAPPDVEREDGLVGRCVLHVRFLTTGAAWP